MNYYDEHWKDDDHFKKWKDEYHHDPKRKYKDESHCCMPPHEKHDFDHDKNNVAADQNNTNTTDQYAYAEANGGDANATLNTALFMAESIVNVAVGGDADAVAVNRNKTCQTNNAQSGDDNDSKACTNKDKK
ncbi:hypothetical protein [Bacillus chungangensis]|uniref:Spore coat protein n=1 Tax=Bacillus chungangensis TaxID=587633 RepID=A0ABT9WSP2_9BACI|nr:hypothetical protein [Bacillus chungangensis]MDQ0176134.1 hypothetical protein [Bacillus chungangensis]